MDNIVESLFGLTPFQVQQQQNAGLNQAADHYASQDPFQRATGGMFRAGGMLGGAGAQAMGMVNPQMEQAKLTEAMMAQGGDLSTSQGLMAKSQQFAAAGDQRTALKLALAGKAKQAEEAKAKLAQNKDDREELKMNRDAIWRHEETLARLEETSRANRAAAENTQLSREQRDIASRRADATDRLAIQMRADSQKAAADAKGEQPPKNLTREARLGWELENGKIDQSTYDAAMAATPGAKLLSEQTGAARSAELGFKSVEDNIAKLYDPKTKEIKPEANALFGKYDQYRPQLLMGQDTIDAGNALDSLTNQVMMTNLADAKERVGQSFGSMQVQEWDKFTQQLTSLKRGLSPKAAGEAMDYVNYFIKTKRGLLKAAMNKSGVPDAKQGGIEKWVRDANGKLVRQ